LKFSMFMHCRRFSPYVSLWGVCTSTSETSSSMYNARNRVESYDGYKFWDVRKSATAVHLHNVVACASRLEGSTFDFSWNLYTNNAPLNEFSSNIPIGTKGGGTCTIILR